MTATKARALDRTLANEPLSVRLSDGASFLPTGTPSDGAQFDKRFDLNFAAGLLYIGSAALGTATSLLAAEPT